MAEVHITAQQGFTKEAQACARVRPEYRPALASRLGGSLGLAMPGGPWVEETGHSVYRLFLHSPRRP